MTPIDVTRLSASLEGRPAPLVIDVRRREAFLKDTKTIAGALRRDPERVADWARELPPAGEVVVCCVHGHEVSQGVARALNDAGRRTSYLERGIAAWQDAGGTMDSKPAASSTRWVTRARPKIDRIACPWLIARFIDRDAEFLYVPTKEVRDVAKAREAIPYDIPDVHFSHEGDLCSFDAFLKHYRLDDPALKQLATIVRGADTARLDLAAQAPGLAAISLGLSRNFADDHEMLKHGMVMYDALYAWCKEGQDETHTWKPAAYA
ncbi:MAG TPA: chromate resistance protein ChrB domain-containing protein [Usitatibacter sp.]|nr:chromate resistance protein ChrB domain-containing protein [Usitatibacter sp.]